MVEGDKVKIAVIALVVLNVLASAATTFMLVRHPQTLHRLQVDYK
jgi:hypothetical protein